MSEKLTGRGGPNRNQGRRPKPLSEKYIQCGLKLPPDIVQWLKDNTGNRNGFIVDAVREAINQLNGTNDKHGTNGESK